MPEHAADDTFTVAGLGEAKPSEDSASKQNTLL